MQSDESILYDHYYSNAIKKYDLLKQKLAEKDFLYLRTDGHPYIISKKKEVIIDPGYIENVINQLQSIKANLQENEGLVTIESSYDEDEESIIIATSYLFTIADIEKCESMAKHYTKDSVWRLQNQPNSIQAKNLRALIDKKSTNKKPQSD